MRIRFGNRVRVVTLLGAALVAGSSLSGRTFALWGASRGPKTIIGGEGGGGFTCDNVARSDALRRFPETFRRYTVSSPFVSPSYAAALASGVFGFSGAITQDQFILTVSLGGRSLTVHKGSGQFQFENRDLLWNPNAPGPSLSRDAAIQFAQAFLLQHNLWPQGAILEDAVPVDAKLPDGTRVMNHWSVMYQVTVDAREGLGAELRVPVSGATVNVLVGNGEVIGLHWNVRTLAADHGPNGTLAAYDLGTALLNARRLYSFTPACPETTTRLSYALQAPTVPQSYAVPSYMFMAEKLDDGVTAPATDFSPRAVITAPLENASFTPCSSVTFSADISGGTPPYDIVWSDPYQIGRTLADGVDPPTAVIGQSNPLTVAMDGGRHVVSLMVTDANGLSWSTEVAIQADQVECVDRALTACSDAAAPVTFRHVDELGWTFDAVITGNDGLRLDDVDMNGKLLANDMELPLYWFQSARMPFQACELKHPPAGNPIDCVSHLQDPGIRVVRTGTSVEVHACYCVDHLPSGEHSGILTVCQVYAFWGVQRGCDPVDTKGACAQYKPWVQYWYVPPLDGTNPFVQVEYSQRFDFEPAVAPNRAAFVQDPDASAWALAEGARNFFGYQDPQPGPVTEGGHLVANFGSPGDKDNYHERGGGEKVLLPGCVSGGLWNCSHIHWRWGAFLKFHGNGKVLPPDTQRVYAWSVRYHPGEIDPIPLDLVNLLFPVAEGIGDVDHDLVFWNQTLDIAPTDLRVSENDWFFH